LTEGQDVLDRLIALTAYGSRLEIFCAASFSFVDRVRNFSAVVKPALAPPPPVFSGFLANPRPL